MLVLFARSFILFGLANHKFGEIPVAYVLGGALREEVDVVFVVFKLVFLLKFCLLLSLLLAQT